MVRQEKSLRQKVLSLKKNRREPFVFIKRRVTIIEEYMEDCTNTKCAMRAICAKRAT
jgi:hypothetical protein